MRIFKKATTKKGEKKRGAALLSVIIISSLLLALTGGLARFSTYQTRDRGRYEVYKDEFAAAEEALNKGFAHIQFLITQGTPDFDNEVAATTPPTVAGYNFSNFNITKTFDGMEAVTEGQWDGLNLYRLRYTIDVTAKSTGKTSTRFSHPGVSLNQGLEITYVPLFNFAIFYDPIMEIAPGPEMDVMGRVHCNGDAYIQAGNALNLHDRFTAAGNIFHGRHPDSGKSSSNGAVNIFNGSEFKGMSRSTGDSNGDGWLDSNDSDWTAAATDTWDDYVKSVDHGVVPLSLPIPTTYDTHSIIERADPVNDSLSLQQEKFEYKAGLKIIADSSGNIVGYDADGNVVDLTYTDPNDASQTKSIVSQTTFFDAREDQTVASLEVNVANMLESGIRPDNGILYVSNEDQSGNMGVVRLINGAELPEGVAVGFSVATDDPMYVKGDYNTTNKTLGMVVGDAISVLSNNWDDANGNDYGARTATETTQNAVMIQGIVKSENNNYSGGVENYFRFLEKWSGINYNYSGSIVLMWESQTAIGKWKYGSPNYSAPRRIWSWDSALGGMNGPPGAPRVVEIIKTNWQIGTSGS